MRVAQVRGHQDAVPHSACAPLARAAAAALRPRRAAAPLRAKTSLALRFSHHVKAVYNYTRRGEPVSALARGEHTDMGVSCCYWATNERYNQLLSPRTVGTSGDNAVERPRADAGAQARRGAGARRCCPRVWLLWAPRCVRLPLQKNLTSRINRVRAKATWRPHFHTVYDLKKAHRGLQGRSLRSTTLAHWDALQAHPLAQMKTNGTVTHKCDLWQGARGVMGEVDIF